MHKFLVYAYKSQDFAQSQKMFAWSHDRETVTFRNSALMRDFLKDNFNVVLVVVASTQHASYAKTQSNITFS